MLGAPFDLPPVLGAAFDLPPALALPFATAPFAFFADCFFLSLAAAAALGLPLSGVVADASDGVFPDGFDVTAGCSTTGSVSVADLSAASSSSSSSSAACVHLTFVPACFFH